VIVEDNSCRSAGWVFKFER